MAEKFNKELKVMDLTANLELPYDPYRIMVGRDYPNQATGIVRTVFRRCVYKTGNLRDALIAWNEKIEGSGEDHMILIADFGLMTMDQSIARTLKGSEYTYRIGERDFFPCLILCEYDIHRGGRVDPCKVTLSVTDGRGHGVRGLNPLDGMIAFTQRAAQGPASVKVSWGVLDAEDGLVRNYTRPFVSRDRATRHHEYHGCAKIVLTHERPEIKIQKNVRASESELSEMLGQLEVGDCIRVDKTGMLFLDKDLTGEDTQQKRGRKLELTPGKVEGAAQAVINA